MIVACVDEILPFSLNWPDAEIYFGGYVPLKANTRKLR